MSAVLPFVPLLVSGAGKFMDLDAQKKAAQNESRYQSQKAGIEEYIARRQGRKDLGKMTAIASAQGQAGSPTFENLLLDSITQTDLDALTIRYGGQVKSDAAKAKAKQAGIAQGFAIGGTLLSQNKSGNTLLGESKRMIFKQ